MKERERERERDKASSVDPPDQDLFLHVDITELQGQQQFDPLHVGIEAAQVPDRSVLVHLGREGGGGGYSIYCYSNNNDSSNMEVSRPLKLHDNPTLV